jgi:hypothetical protein
MLDPAIKAKAKALYDRDRSDLTHETRPDAMEEYRVKVPWEDAPAEVRAKFIDDVAIAMGQPRA